MKEAKSSLAWDFYVISEELKRLIFLCRKLEQEFIEELDELNGVRKAFEEEVRNWEKPGRKSAKKKLKTQGKQLSIYFEDFSQEFNY